MMTKRDILVRMAVDLGVADYPDSTSNAPTLPADQATLARLINGFEDGRAALYAENPKFRLDQWEESITVDPTATDPGSVTLKAGIIAPPLGTLQFYYSDGGYGGPLDVTNWTRVNAHRASSPNATGRPQFASFWEKAPTDAGEERRWEMRIYPAPDRPYIVRGLFKHKCLPLADLSDVEPSGYPHAVLAFAIWEIQQVNPIPTGPTQAAALARRADWLARVTTQEMAKGPRTLGRSGKTKTLFRSRSMAPRIEVTLSDGSLLSDYVPE